MKPTKQQQQAIDCQDRPLFIQAGAGTGKTATLSRRVGRQLEDSSVDSVRDLMIITFTNKAAGELMGRIRAELRSRGLVADALQIDSALISTIHHMCTELLNEHALEADIDPGAVMLSEEDAAVLRAKALEVLLSQREKNEDVQFLLENLNGVRSVTKFIKRLFELEAGSDSSLTELERAPKILDPLKEMRQRYSSILACKIELESMGIESEEGTGTATPWLNIVNVCSRLESLLLEDDISWGALDKFFQEYKIGPGHCKKIYKEQFIDSSFKYNELRSIFECVLKQKLLNAGLKVAGEAYSHYNALKKRSRLRDTNDLQKDLYKLLHANPEIVKQYRDRFSTVMIDEFQDTDPLQVGIIMHICDEALNTLTTVGDAQQAIYGFRGADIETYRNMRECMKEKDALVLNLDTNFRSHPDILHFVKAIFEKDNFFGNEFLDIKAGRADTHCDWIDDNSPRVRMHFVAGHGKQDGIKATSAKDLFEVQAELIAQQFEELAKNGVPYGKMAILLRAFAGGKSSVVVEALRKHSIPCVVSGGQDYFCRKEVIALVYLLRFLQLRDDDEVLLKLLTSIFFDISDDCLLELGVVQHRERKINKDGKKMKMSLYDAMCYQVGLLPKNIDDPLVKAKQILEIALQMSEYAPIMEVIEYVVRTSGLYATLQESGAQGMAAQANIAYFGDLLQDYVSQHNSDISSIAYHFKEICDTAQKGLGGRGKTSSMIAFGSNVVQIMTIHASKGLEFPVVATIQSSGKPRQKFGPENVSVLSEDGKRYLYYPTRSSFLKCEDVPAHLAEARNAIEFNECARLYTIEQDLQETQRLFYVALTRARDLLIYVAGTENYVTKNEVKEGSVRDVCNALFAEEFSTVDKNYESSNGSMFEFHYSEAPCKRQDSVDGENREEALLQNKQQEKWEDAPEDDFVPQLRARALLSEPLVLRCHNEYLKDMHSYSSLAKEKKSPRMSDAYAHLRSREDDIDTVSSIGSAFHQVAQWIAENFASGWSDESLNRRVDAAAKRWGVDENDMPRLQEAIKTWLISDYFKEIGSYKQIFAEYAFCVPLNDMFLEGSIDLLCLSENGTARIIDYKTGTSGTDSELHDRYLLQASVYAYAVLSAGLCEKVELVFLRIEDEMKPTTFVWQASDLNTLRKMILS